MSEKSSTSQPPGTQSAASFYPLTLDVGQLLRAANLTAAEWRLWSYLVTLDPFGDRYHEMPDLLTILKECQISKPTFYRAIAKLQEARLFDIQPIRTDFRNLQGKKTRSENSLKNETAVSPLRKKSQKRDANLKNETEISALRIESQERENRSPKPATHNGCRSPQTLQTDQTDQTLSLPPPTPERELLEFVIRNVSNTDGIKNPRAYALKILQRDRQHWEETFSQWQQRQTGTHIPPPSPEQQKFDERESLIGLIRLKHQQGKPISTALKQKATQLGIDLNGTD